ncbi:MAG: carbohydrate ABC transporter permease [Fimbriimonadaceae bacterium]
MDAGLRGRQSGTLGGNCYDHAAFAPGWKPGLHMFRYGRAACAPGWNPGLHMFRYGRAAFAPGWKPGLHMFRYGWAAFAPGWKPGLHMFCYGRAAFVPGWEGTPRVKRASPLPFLLPNLIGFLVFTLAPIVVSLGASITDWNLERPGATAVVGGRNFVELLGDEKFWLSLLNTLYLMLGIPVSIGVSLWLAVLLHRRLRGVDAYKAILFLPSVTSGVAIMLLWKQLYNPELGPINMLIERLLHVHGPQWLQSTQNLAALKVEHVGVAHKQFGIGARDAINLLGVWAGIGGSNMLLYLAGLTNVPEELIEAAYVDGAGKWAAFRRITWPQLAPTTFFIVVMSIIGGLQGGFETARVMTTGGPAGTTTTVAYYIFNKAFEEYRLGYASAVTWVLFAVIFAVTLFNWRFGNQETGMA